MTSPGRSSITLMSFITCKEEEEEVEQEEVEQEEVEVEEVEEEEVEVGGGRGEGGLND
jgi:hypothetical protein